VFAQLQAAHGEVDFFWVDIEDEEEVLGDLDVETFPTLLIASAERLRFAGPSLPTYESVARLIRACLAQTVTQRDSSNVANSYRDVFRRFTDLRLRDKS
jgi:hypothetical protein